MNAAVKANRQWREKIIRETVDNGGATVPLAAFTLLAAEVTRLENLLEVKDRVILNVVQEQTRLRVAAGEIHISETMNLDTTPEAVEAARVKFGI